MCRVRVQSSPSIISTSQLNHCSKSSGWLSSLKRMAHDATLGHPDYMRNFWVGHPDDLAIGNITSEWLRLSAVSHPDHLWLMQCVIWMTYGHPDGTTKFQPYVIRMTQFLAVSHPDDLWLMQYVIRMTYDVTQSSGWYNESWLLCQCLSSWLYLIRMTYGRYNVSSRWSMVNRLT